MDTSPFQIRGVVEAFYGTYYTFPERNDLIRFLGENGFNFYLYGPKNDRQHRMRWWAPYPAAILGDFAQSIRIARDVGVEFCYAISFGVPPDYASETDFEIVTRKLRDFYDRGCRAFGLLVDDTTMGFAHDVNRRAFPGLADAHADYGNRLLEWMRALDPACTLYLCPTEYFGRPPFGRYLQELGRQLDPDVQVFYSGTAICSRRITVPEVQAFAEVVRRNPLIWDNYPTNDLHMRPDMHIGPLRHRDPLLPSVCTGLLSNPMNQKEASKVPLLTIADYLNDPEGYDAGVSWERALDAMGAESSSSLRRFAENSLRSALSDDQAPTLTALTREALTQLRRGERVTESTAVASLSGYFDILDEASYDLKNRMRNLALRQNILPWIEALDEKFWMGRGALRVLNAIEAGEDCGSALRFMNELLDDIEHNPKHIGGPALLELAEYARARAIVAGCEGGPVSVDPAAQIATDRPAVDPGLSLPDVRVGRG